MGCGNTLVNAHQARNIAEDKLAQDAEEEFQRTLVAIEKAAEKGEREVQVNSLMNYECDYVASKLEDMLFTAKPIRDMPYGNICILIVSW